MHVLFDVIAYNILKLFRIKNKMGIGLAIGAASHEVGTSKAIEMGEIQGAMASIAIGITGIHTVILSVLL